MPDEEQSSLFLEQIIESTFEALSENETFDEVKWTPSLGQGRSGIKRESRCSCQ